MIKITAHDHCHCLHHSKNDTIINNEVDSDANVVDEEDVRKMNLDDVIDDGDVDAKYKTLITMTSSIH